MGREEVPAFVVFEMDARVGNPATKVVAIGVAQQVEGGGVHVHAHDVAGVEGEGVQDVEAATDSDHEHARLRHRRGLVGGGVDRLLDAAQRLGAPVVVDGERECEVVLGEQSLEAGQEGPVRAEERGEGHAPRLGRRYP